MTDDQFLEGGPRTSRTSGTTGSTNRLEPRSLWKRPEFIGPIILGVVAVVIVIVLGGGG